MIRIFCVGMATIDHVVRLEKISSEAIGRSATPARAEVDALPARWPA